MNFSIAIIVCRENGDKIDNLIHFRSKIVILGVKIDIEIKNLKKIENLKA